MLHAHRFFVVSDFSKKSPREAAWLPVSKVPTVTGLEAFVVSITRSNPASFGCSVFTSLWTTCTTGDHPRFLALPRRMALVAVPSVCASI